MAEVKVDIWGCCTSRDVFNAQGPNREWMFKTLSGLDLENSYKINRYFQNCSFISQSSEHHGPEITEEFLRKNFADMNNFDIRCTLDECNGNVFGKLMESDSEWLIVDLRYLIYDITIFHYSGGSEDYICNKCAAKYARFLDDENIEYTKREFKREEFNYSPSFKVFTDFVKKRYGDKIILIEVRESEIFLDENTIFNLYKKTQSRSLLIEYEYMSRFAEETGCYVVRAPFMLSADNLHQWGKGDSVHYISEYYDYAIKCIDCIVEGKDVCKKLDRHYLDYSHRFVAMQAGLIRSVNNTIRRIIKCNDKKDYAESLDLIDQLIEQDVPDGYYLKSMMLKKGNGVEKDLQESARLMLEASEKGIEKAKWEYFDLLWSIKTSEADKQAFEYAFENKENRQMTARLARAYFNGRGVEKNLPLAAELMESVIPEGPQWAQWEYFDFLWAMVDRDDEMIEFARPIAENGDKEMQGRMGRAYRDGRGVEKNLDFAIEWMRKASDQHLAWATNELFDMLWDTGESGCFEEMIDMITPLAEAGNGNAMRRLSHAYRDGKGVEQDLSQARLWLERAAEKNNKWAQKELRQMDEAN